MKNAPLKAKPKTGLGSLNNKTKSDESPNFEPRKADYEIQAEEKNRNMSKTKKQGVKKTKVVKAKEIGKLEITSGNSVKKQSD